MPVVTSSEVRYPVNTADLLDEVLSGGSSDASHVSAWSDFASYPTLGASSTASSFPYGGSSSFPVSHAPMGLSAPSGLQGCSDCIKLRYNVKGLQQQLQSARIERKNIEDLKKKILNTDVLIRKFHEKNQECETNKKKVRELTIKGKQTHQELDSLQASYTAALKELEPLRQAKTLFEASNQELTTKLNRLQIDFDAIKQVKQQLELKCKELKETEKKERERIAEEKKSKKADKSRDDEIKALKEAHRVEKSELLSRRSILEHKLKKGLKRIHYYESILEEHPSAKPPGYRTSRLKLEDDDDEAADADALESMLLSSDANRPSHTQSAADKTTQTSQHTTTSEDMPFRSPTRVSFALPHGKESPGRRPRRDSDLPEPESMMSEKLKSHQQLLTPTRTTPPSKTSSTTKTSPSTAGTKKRHSSENSGRPAVETVTHRRSLLNRIWGGDDDQSGSESGCGGPVSVALVSGTGRNQKKSRKGSDIVNDGIGVSPGRRRSRRVSSSTSEDEVRSQKESSHYSLLQDHDGSTVSSTNRESLVQQLGMNLSDSEDDDVDKTSNGREQMSTSFAATSTAGTLPKPSTSGASATSATPTAVASRLKSRTSQAITASRSNEDLEEFVARKKDVIMMVGGRRKTKDESKRESDEDSKEKGKPLKDDGEKMAKSEEEAEAPCDNGQSHRVAKNSLGESDSTAETSSQKVNPSLNCDSVDDFYSSKENVATSASAIATFSTTVPTPLSTGIQTPSRPAFGGSPQRPKRVAHTPKSDASAKAEATTEASSLETAEVSDFQSSSSVDATAKIAPPESVSFSDDIDDEFGDDADGDHRDDDDDDVEEEFVDPEEETIKPPNLVEPLDPIPLDLEDGYEEDLHAKEDEDENMSGGDDGIDDDDVASALSELRELISFVGESEVSPLQPSSATVSMEYEENLTSCSPKLARGSFLDTAGNTDGEGIDVDNIDPECVKEEDSEGSSCKIAQNEIIVASESGRGEGWTEAESLKSGLASSAATKSFTEAGLCEALAGTVGDEEDEGVWQPRRPKGRRSQSIDSSDDEDFMDKGIGCREGKNEETDQTSLVDGDPSLTAGSAMRRTMSKIIGRRTRSITSYPATSIAEIISLNRSSRSRSNSSKTQPSNAVKGKRDEKSITSKERRNSSSDSVKILVASLVRETAKMDTGEDSIVSAEGAKDATDAAGVASKEAVVDEGTDVIAEGTDVVGIRTNVVADRTDVLEETVAVAEARDTVGTGSDGVCEATDAAGEMRDGLGETTDAVGEVTYVVGEATDAVAEATDAVAEATDAVGEATDAVEGLRDAVEGPEVAVAEGIDVAAKGRDVAADKTAVAKGTNVSVEVSYGIDMIDVNAAIKDVYVADALEMSEDAVNKDEDSKQRTTRLKSAGKACLNSPAIRRRTSDNSQGSEKKVGHRRKGGSVLCGDLCTPALSTAKAASQFTEVVEDNEDVLADSSDDSFEERATAVSPLASILIEKNKSKLNVRTITPVKPLDVDDLEADVEATDSSLNESASGSAVREFSTSSRAGAASFLKLPSSDTDLLSDEVFEPSDNGSDTSKPKPASAAESPVAGATKPESANLSTDEAPTLVFPTPKSLSAESTITTPSPLRRSSRRLSASTPTALSASDLKKNSNDSKTLSFEEFMAEKTPKEGASTEETWATRSSKPAGKRASGFLTLRSTRSRRSTPEEQRSVSSGSVLCEKSDESDGISGEKRLTNSAEGTVDDLVHNVVAEATSESTEKVDALSTSFRRARASSKTRGKRTSGLESMHEIFQNVPEAVNRIHQTASDHPDDWTTSDRAAVYGPKSSRCDLDLPDDDEIEDMAAALASPPSSRGDEGEPHLSDDNRKNDGGEGDDDESNLGTRKSSVGNKRKSGGGTSNSASSAKRSRGCDGKRGKSGVGDDNEDDVGHGVGGKRVASTRSLRGRLPREMTPPTEEENVIDSPTEELSSVTKKQKLTTTARTPPPKTAPKKSTSTAKKQKTSMPDESALAELVESTAESAKPEAISPRRTRNKSNSQPITPDLEVKEKRGGGGRRRSAKSLVKSTNVTTFPAAEAGICSRAKRRSADSPEEKPATMTYTTSSSPVTDDTLLAAREEFRRLGADVFSTEFSGGASTAASDNAAAEATLLSPLRNIDSPSERFVSVDKDEPFLISPLRSSNLAISPSRSDRSAALVSPHRSDRIAAQKEAKELKAVEIQTMIKARRERSARLPASAPSQSPSSVATEEQSSSLSSLDSSKSSKESSLCKPDQPSATPTPSSAPSSSRQSGQTSSSPASTTSAIDGRQQRQQQTRRQPASRTSNPGFLTGDKRLKVMRKRAMEAKRSKVAEVVKPDPKCDAPDLEDISTIASKRKVRVAHVKTTSVNSKPKANLTRSSPTLASKEPREQGLEDVRSTGSAQEEKGAVQKAQQLKQTPQPPPSQLQSLPALSAVVDVPRRRAGDSIPKRRNALAGASSKYEQIDFLALEVEESLVQVEGPLQPLISTILIQHNFVESFMDDAALNHLIDDLKKPRLSSPDVEIATFNSAVVDVCIKYLSHPGFLTGANQLLISSLVAGMKHHYRSPSIIIASAASSSSSPSSSSSRSVLFPSSPALSRLLSPLETNAIRLLAKLDNGEVTPITTTGKALATTNNRLEGNPHCLQLLGECHRKIFGDEDSTKYSAHYVQRFVRVASALYVFFSSASSFRIFLFDLLRTNKSAIADKILIYLANALVIWPQLALGYRGKDDPVSPLAMTLRHVVAKKLLFEAKMHVADHARPMHDLFHEWVIPLIPSPPGVNGANFSKTSFAQTIFLAKVLNEQVDNSRKLVVITQDDVEATKVGLEYLKCLTFIGSQQAWGWVTSILLESFCLKEVNQLGLTLEFLEDEDDLGVSSTPRVASSKLLPTNYGNSSYARALFLLYAVPQVIASSPLSNANDVALVATRLCHALESAATTAYSSVASHSPTVASSTAESSSASLDSAKTSSTADASAAETGTVDSSAAGPTWEAQLVLVNVLVHLIFLEGVGKSLKAKKRVVDAIFRWMEAKTKTLQNHCPLKLKERLTKVLILKKTLGGPRDIR